MNKDAEKSGFGRLWSGTRQEPPEPKAEVKEEKVVPLHDHGYAAFEIRDRAERMHIHCATQPSRYPSYHHLLDIIFDHDFEGVFTLIYSFMAVEVTGKHLAPVVHAISFGNCGCIREYHKKLYGSPAPKNEPVIESITIVAAAHQAADTPVAAEN